jgi:hypothetical protein
MALNCTQLCSMNLWMLLDLLATILEGELVNVARFASYNYGGKSMHPHLGELVICTF